MVFVGHSWGADLGLAFALERSPKVRALVGIAGGRIVDDREWSRLYHERRELVGELEPDYAFPPNLAVNRALNAEWKAYCKAPDLLWRHRSARRPGALGDRFGRHSTELAHRTTRRVTTARCSPAGSSARAT